MMLVVAEGHDGGVFEHEAGKNRQWPGDCG